jgi:Asp-tRNA(Asn)/Glu-tRNA(Gln) amidotransferase C subunit
MGRFVAGVAVVGLLMAAGCGDDDDGASSEEIEEFCNGFNEINDEFTDINPVTDPGALQDALEMLRDLKPPGEIANDYEMVLDGFERLSEIDITDREAVAQVQEDLPAAEEAFNTVGDFVEREC